jgi:FTR1 family protein
MLQSFVIFWREGFEAFLIVAIILTYLRKTGRVWLRPAVFTAIGAAVIASIALGVVLKRGVGNQALWEGVLGLVAVGLVGSLIVHMWRTAHQLKANMEERLQQVAANGSRKSAWLGVFFLTAFMITREGMETALMLLQVRDSRFLLGLVLGLSAAATMAWIWTRFGHLIDLRRFFQVTGIFLLLFMTQIAIYSFHELTEAGVIPHSETLHEATEPFSPYGTYGKWFPSLILVICGGWLAAVWMMDRRRRQQAALVLGALVMAALSAPAPVHAQAAGNEPVSAAEVDSLRAEFERRLDVLAGEIEGMKLGEAAGRPVGGPVPQGLGRSAAKVYRVDRGVSLGGYGEMVYENFGDEREDGTPVAITDRLDFLRGVLYVGYKFNDRWVFNSEIEFEHASTGRGGEVSLEFAYIDALCRPELNFRAGLLLLPLGITNELHEPTTFLSVRRPNIERSIIPTTWRENGAGIYGDIGPMTYRTYVVNGLDATGFGAGGIRGGRQAGAQTKIDDVAWTGRLDYTGTPGFLAGISAYTGDAAQDLLDVDGDELEARTTVIDGHGEWTWRGLEVRGLGARATIDNVAELNAAHPDSLIGAESIGETLVGYYLQVGYDVLSRRSSVQALIPFVRWEALNTQDEVPAGFAANPANDAQTLTVGAAYRPIDQVIFKADYQDVSNEADTGVDQFNVALGYIF